MAQVNIRIDDSLKEQADVLLNELGMNMSTAIIIFLRQTIREGGIPFDITTKTDPFFSESNMKVLRQSLQDANDGRLTAHELIEE